MLYRHCKLNELKYVLNKKSNTQFCYEFGKPKRSVYKCENRFSIFQSSPPVGSFNKIVCLKSFQSLILFSAF